MEVKEFQTSEAVATFCTRRRCLNHPRPHLELMDTHHHRDQHAPYAERYPMCACRSSPWIAKNNPYKAAGLWETVDTAIPRNTGQGILQLFLKLPAAGILPPPISFICQVHGGERIPLSCLDTSTSLKELLYGAPNNYEYLLLLRQVNLRLPDLRTGLALLQPLQAGQQQQPQQQLQQRQRAQSILVKPVLTLQDCIN